MHGCYVSVLTYYGTLASKLTKGLCSDCRQPLGVTETTPVSLLIVSWYLLSYRRIVVAS